MALKPKNSPAFEAEPGTGGDTVVDTGASAGPATAALPEQTGEARAPAPQTSHQVVATSAAAAIAKAFRKEVEEMHDAADFSYGSHRVFKADNGVICELTGEKKSLGRWVKVQLMAWGRTYQVSPGEKGKESSVFVAYSKDGITIDKAGEGQSAWEGKPVEEYLQHLRTVEGFEEAKRREFIDCQVAVLGCEEDPEFRGIVQITLSATSIPAFRSYQTQLDATAKAVTMGLPGYAMPENPFQFYFIREAASGNGNTWTKLKVSSTLPAKI